CKDDIGASKPPIRSRMGENLCKIRSNQAIKVFAELFSKSDNPNPLTFSSAQNECEHSAKSRAYCCRYPSTISKKREAK
ncbi:MAG: hypothetical protein IJP20_04760, partial [Clostridia bacterium]|nr:hypothetical protein [Clostridia bacterium]